MDFLGRWNTTSDNELGNCNCPTQTDLPVCGPATATTKPAVEKAPKSKRTVYFGALLVAVVLVLLVAAVAAAVASVIIISHRQRQYNNAQPGFLSYVNEDSPVAAEEQLQRGFIPISHLNSIDLSLFESMKSLNLQWGVPPNELEYFYAIESVFRDGATKTTTLMLSSGHRFVSSDSGAQLLDDQGKVLGTLVFNVEAEETNEGLEFEEEKAESRRLGKGKGYGRYPTNSPAGLPDSFFDAYCRYGCGGMAVTFPYYYRPFFGYGFPLVGTEALFPQGYGGYPAAELLASQAAQPSFTANTGPGLGGGFTSPQYGSTSVVGGNQAVPVSIPQY